MEFDPEFEFECPKWVDFEDEEQEMKELENFAEGLDDSWFEKEHPLHEPKDKDKKELELRPLIGMKHPVDNDNKIHESLTTTKKSAKAKNPKKSLGFKKSVAFHRKEKRRILPEITDRINQGEKRKNVDDYVDRRNEFSQKRDCTPSTTYDSPSKRIDNNVQNSSPLSSLTPTRGNIKSPLMTKSPKHSLNAKAIDGQRKRRRLPTIPTEVSNTLDPSNLLPQRAHSASDQTSHSKSKDLYFSPQKLDIYTKPMNSIQQKTSTNITELKNKDDNVSVEKLLKLHNQKVMASKCKYDSNGRRIKSDYTDMYSTKYNTITSSTSTSTNRLGSHKEQNINLVDDQNIMNDDYKRKGQCIANDDSQSITTIIEESGVNSHLNSTYVCEDNVENQGKINISGTTVTSNKEAKMPNKSSTLQYANENIGSIEEIKEQDSRKAKEENEELSIEELLKQHNKKVMASKCKYDSNGRRIQPANPVFCPAPSEPKTTKKATLTRTTSQKPTWKNKKREQQANSNSDHKSKTKHLRRSYDAAPSDRATIKQKRRSCFTVKPSKGESDDEEQKNLIVRHNQILAKSK